MSSTNYHNEKAKVGRSATSCLECQRRKQKCSREWPCNHCQSRKVPHLCQFASRKLSAPDNDSSFVPPKLSRKRKEDSFESDFSALADDPDHGLSDGLARLGYMPGHDFFGLAKSGISPPNDCGADVVAAQSEEVELALKTVLPKPYTDVLVQNFLEIANFQYYPIFPEQLRGQCSKWWEARAAGRRLSPEFTCLLIRVCAVSAQYLEKSLKQRLELELGEKAQSLTERFHAAAHKLSATIPRGAGGVVQVQQLFLDASWWKSEANVVQSWHALSVAIREAQEIGMHKHVEDLPHFERDLRKRLWCVLWTWDWQMSTLLSRPLLIDQDDHKLEIPDGRLENITDPEAPHPLSSVALQAGLGVNVSHLFQRMGTDTSVQLVLEIEEVLERWMSTFPAALRDHRPDTRWDAQYPNVPFMRCQINVIAYCYLLAPLKPYLLGNADSKIMNTQLGTDLQLKGVDTCLDLMRASEKFYELIFPQSIKYFFIIFFMFDAATVMCSAIVHDLERTLPKRNQCLRSLRTAQELMDGVTHLSETANISARLLRKLTAALPLTPAEMQVLGVERVLTGKKMKTSSSPPDAFGSGVPPGSEYRFQVAGNGSASTSSTRTNSMPNTAVMTPYGVHPRRQQQQQQQQQPYAQGPNRVQAPQGGYGHTPMPPAAGTEWAFPNYGLTAPVTTTTGGGFDGLGVGAAGGVSVTVNVNQVVPAQLGDPLTGTYLDQLWDWDRLNMDLPSYSMPEYGI